MLGPTEPTPSPRHPGTEFHKLLAASAASNLGDGIALRAAPLLAVSLTRDPSLISGLVLASACHGCCSHSGAALWPTGWIEGG